MNGFECARAQMIMVEFVDGDLAPNPADDRSAWLHSHLEACGECRAALARLENIDNELARWGMHVGRETAPAPDQRERLAARLEPSPRHRKVALGLAVAAALALAVIAPYRTATVTTRPADGNEARFVSIPFLAPLDPRENATIVRMDIQVATLLAVGYRTTADPDTVVPADVLVGEDGRAHAVRVLSDVTLNGTGD